jgi:hypothetical protein
MIKEQVTLSFDIETLSSEHVEVIIDIAATAIARALPHHIKEINAKIISYEYETWIGARIRKWRTR